MSKQEKEETGKKIVALNRKARFNYQIIETLEAGIVLTGPEIKSIRANGVSIAESYVKPFNGEIFLLNAHINPYVFDSSSTYDPLRQRKLLLSKGQIEKWQSRVEAKGLTIVPLSLYLKDGWAKLEIALAKGKAAPDKRQDIKNREGKREIQRALKG